MSDQRNLEAFIQEVMEQFCEVAWIDITECTLVQSAPLNTLAPGDELVCTVRCKGVDTHLGVGAQLYDDEVHLPIVYRGHCSETGKVLFKMPERSVTVRLASDDWFVCWGESTSVWCADEYGKKRQEWRTGQCYSVKELQNQQRVPFAYDGDILLHPEIQTAA